MDGGAHVAGCPTNSVILLLSESQISDGTALMLDAFPKGRAKARAPLGDGYDAHGFRHALFECGINPCIPSSTNRKIAIPHDVRSIANVIGYKICSANQRLATRPTPATTAAPILSCPSLYRRLFKGFGRTLESATA